MKKANKSHQDPRQEGRAITLANQISAWLGTKTARVIVLLLFALQASLLAIVINPGTPPDENNHWRFINFYANNSLLPIFTEQEPTVNLGDKTREPDYLYHYGMSLVVRVMPFTEQSERIIIRLFSVVLAVLSFIFLAKVLSKLKISETITTVTILLLSQLSMVLLMSSAVNNDTLVWLGMTVGLWLLLEIWEKPRTVYVLGLLLLPAYGVLLKRTLLPVAVSIWLVAIIILWLQRTAFLSDLKATFSRPKPIIIILMALLVIGIGFSAERIGGNVLRYGKVVPTCEDVQGEKACYNFWASARARELARREPQPQIAPPVFVVRWTHDSVQNILDIQTQWWRHEKMPPSWLTPISITLIGIGIGLGVWYDGRRFRINEASRKRLVVLGLGLFYIASHLLVNYNEYQSQGFYGLALNGRYILAGLFPVVGLVVYYWSKLLRKWPLAQFGMAVLVIGLLAIFSGLSLLMRNPQLFHG